MLKWLYFIMQFLLVDLRCHGDSASIKKLPHTVASAALDVLKLVGNSWPSSVRCCCSVWFSFILYQHNHFSVSVILRFSFFAFFWGYSATHLTGRLFYFRSNHQGSNLILIFPMKGGMPWHWFISGLASVIFLKPQLIAFFSSVYYSTNSALCVIATLHYSLNARKTYIYLLFYSKVWYFQRKNEC